MDTNMTLFSSGMFPVLESQVMGSAIPVGVSQSDMSGFGNLLDIVSDMQLGDEQGLAQSDFLTEKTESLFDSEVQSLIGSASQIAVRDMILPKDSATPAREMSIGRSKEPSSEIPLQASNWLINAQELGSLAQTQNLSRIETHEGSKADSVRIWAAALATGDIKSVQVETLPEIPLRQKAEMDLGLMDALGSFSEVPTQERAKTDFRLMDAPQAPPVFNSSPKPVVASLEKAPPVAFAGSEKAGPQKSEAATFERLVPEVVNMSRVVEAPKGAVRGEVSELKVSEGNSTERSESSEVKGKSPTSVAAVAVPAKQARQEFSGDSSFDDKAEKKDTSKPVTGADFILSRSTTETTSAQKSGALELPQKLGAPSDRRISSGTVDFVADKVDALRAQGGGRLRVEMSPKDLGGLEIRVSMARGQMKVELFAERPETLQAVRNSSSELGAKLSAIAPAQLEIGALSSQPAMEKMVRNENISSDLMKVRSDLTSEVGTRRMEMASSEMGSHSGSFSDKQGQGDRAMSSSDWMSGRDEFGREGREQRRQKAMDQWEADLERKSA